MLSFRNLTRRPATVVQLGATRDTEPVAATTRASTVPASGRKAQMSAVVAVEQFLAQMVAHGGGGELPWPRVKDSYDAQRKANGWPRISDQLLSAFLSALGCTRERRRTKDGRRPTFVRFPEVFQQTPQRVRA